MPRALAFVLALLSLTSSASSETAATQSNTYPVALFAAYHPDNRVVQSLSLQGSHSTHVALVCCKVCSVGKACGNTCISRKKTCHVGQGCACDG